MKQVQFKDVVKHVIIHAINVQMGHNVLNVMQIIKDKHQQIYVPVLLNIMKILTLYYAKHAFIIVKRVLYKINAVHVNMLLTKELSIQIQCYVNVNKNIMMMEHINYVNLV